MRYRAIRHIKIFSTVFLVGLLVGQPAAFAAQYEPESSHLSQKEQMSIALTIYNNNSAVIRDRRKAHLPRGLVALEYVDVAKLIDPTSVSTRSLEAADGISVLEQSYRYDLLNRQSLLENYVGRKVKYSRELLEGSKYEKVLREGILLSINPEIVEFGDVIEISPEGVISLPHLPEDLNLSPTLDWLLENRIRGEQILETSYITSGITWQANYTIVLDEKHNIFDLGSWVTINNQSGVAYSNAQITLVAGDVNRVTHGRQQPRMLMERSMAMAASSDLVQAKAAFEYHQYQMPLVTDIKNKESKQLRFIAADKVAFKKSYEFNSQIQSYQQAQQSKLNAEVRISFANTRKNHLGKPLPKGIARVYQGDTEGNLLLVGEDNFNAKARGEEVELTLGRAFDVYAERKQTDFKKLADRLIQSTYEVKVHNKKDSAVEVTINESMQGQWKIIEQNESGKKINSTTQQYKLTIPKRSSKTLRFTAQSRF